MKTRDLMIPISDYLRPETTLKEAVNLLRIARRGNEQVGVKALPVLDAKGKFAGILSMSDILKAVHPSYMNMMNLGDFTWDGMLEEMAKKIAGRTVGEVMNRSALAVKECDFLMECVDHMIKNGVQRIPVVDNAGKATGMIYERDVFYAIVKSMLD